MTIIQNRTSLMPENIESAVQAVFTLSPREVEALVPDFINSVLDNADACKAAASEVDKSFIALTGLASEMALACTHKVGLYSISLTMVLNNIRSSLRTGSRGNNIHYETLKIQQEGDERVLKQRLETHKLFKEVGHSN